MTGKPRRPWFARWRWWVCWLVYITTAIMLVHAFHLGDSWWCWLFWLGAAAAAEVTANEWEDADDANR